MAKIDAVIAALRTVLEEAESRTDESYWNVAVLNRWIARLPGAWLGRWRQLRLRGNSFSSVEREDLISHVRATLAYLENRKTAQSTGLWRWLPTLRRRQPSVSPTSNKRLLH
jgi:hypothetical protein